MFGLNAYQYGIGDASITIPFAKLAADPRLYPGDYLLAQRPYYYTFLWTAVGWIHAHAGLSFMALYLTGYALALFGTFVAVHELSMTLFGRRDVAALTLVFLLVSKHTLGSVYTIESVFSTRQAATPLLLFALSAFLRGRMAWSGVLLGLAYLVHPITAHYVVAMFVAAGVVGLAPWSRRRVITALACFAVVASPLIAWRLTHTPRAERLLTPDPRWLEAIHLRSAHHMLPSTWNPVNWVQVVLVITACTIGWWWGRDRVQPERHRMMRVFATTVLVLCAVGLVFAEPIPVAAVLIAQPLRSFQFMEYFAMLYGAYFVATELPAARSVLRALAVVAIGVALFPAPHFRPESVVVYLIAAAMLLAYREARPAAVRRIALAGIALLAGAAAGALHVALRDGQGFSAADAQPPAWLDVQDWARTRTSRGAEFIVPPTIEADFRVESERGVYADYADGGLLNGNPEFGIEWLRRLRALGMQHDRIAGLEPAYAALDAATVQSIAHELNGRHRPVYFVTDTAAQPLPFHVRYRNSSYVVYEVRPQS